MGRYYLRSRETIRAGGIVESCPTEINDDDSYIETPNVDNFGVSFVFERVLRRLDVHSEQKKLQQTKFDGHLKKYVADIEVLELKLSQKTKDFNNLHDKFKGLQKQLVEIKTEKDLLEMKLQHEQETSYRMNRDAENLRWTRNELMDMINRSRDINELRKRMAAKRLYQ